MRLKLNPSTKEAFLKIISPLGIDKVHEVFQSFLRDAKPISTEEFSLIMDVSLDDALTVAKNKGELNQKGDLVGFLGLSVVLTNHAFRVHGKMLYTWCAADTLVFPAILNTKAEIESNDPLSGEQIKIEVDGDYLISVEPTGAMISWVDEIDNNDIRCSMCNRVHFFASGATAESWLVNNQDARIFTVKEFFASDIVNTTA